MHILISSCMNMVKDICVKDADLSGSRSTVFFSMLARYIRYGRSKPLSTLSFTRMFLSVITTTNNNASNNDNKTITHRLSIN